MGGPESAGVGPASQPSAATTGRAASTEPTEPTMPSEARRHSPLFDGVRRRIEDYVGQSGLQPGDRLPPERTLAAQLGVSRNSLRQALATLADAGVVTVVHGSGAYLTEVPARRAARYLASALVQHNRDLPEVVPVRSVLESLAARMAASSRTNSQLARMERAIRGMAAELAAGHDGERYSAAFHHAVWDASHNRVLRDQLTGLQPELDRLRQEALAQPDSLAKAVVAHRYVFELIRNGDEDGAAAAMGQHITEAAQSPLAQPFSPRKGSTP